MLYKASERQELDSLATASQCVTYSCEQEEWMVKSKGGLAEKLHSVEEVKRICEVLYSRLVSGL